MHEKSNAHVGNLHPNKNKNEFISIFANKFYLPNISTTFIGRSKLLDDLWKHTPRSEEPNSNG